MRVIDNYLPSEVADKIEANLINDWFPWFYTSQVVKPYNVSCFTHILLDERNKKSDYADEILLPIVSNIDGRKMLRAKANCYTKTENYIHYPYHLDRQDDDFKVAIYYVNTNNGYTEIKDKGKVESVKNRLLLMNGDEEHRCTNQTDKELRVNININYK